MNPFPFSETDPIVYAGPPPTSSDVVIIGGGIIGITTALYLAQQKVSVTVLEKGRVAAEQSSRNWGWIRQQGRDEDELPIMIEAARLWPQLVQECGEDIGLRQTGVTYLASADKDMADFEAFVRIAAAHDMDTRMLDAGDMSELVKGMSGTFKGGMITPSDMRAEPSLAVPALARLARRKGVTIVENCAARALEMTAGRTAGVWSEQGYIASPVVLLAGGAWSSLFLKRHGITIPQLSVKATVVATQPMPDFHAGAVAGKHIAFRRRLDGGYTLAPAASHRLYLGPDALRHAAKYVPALKADPLGTRYGLRAPAGYPDSWTTPRTWTPEVPGPFEHMRVLNPAPDASDLRSIERGFRRMFPQLEPVRFQKCWAGMIDLMPDTVPIVDWIPSHSGLLVATGMSGHGFGIGPGMGRVIADMIQGNVVGHNLHRFRFSRFTDGSPIRLGTSL